MAVCRGADPHLGPGRRNDERLDSSQHLGVDDFFSCIVAIDEAAMLTHSRDTSVAVADITQLCGLRRENGFGIRCGSTWQCYGGAHLLRIAMLLNYPLLLIDHIDEKECFVNSLRNYGFCSTFSCVWCSSCSLSAAPGAIFVSLLISFS